jgi:hypothetical protein
MFMIITETVHHDHHSKTEYEFRYDVDTEKLTYNCARLLNRQYAKTFQWVGEEVKNLLAPKEIKQAALARAKEHLAVMKAREEKAA